MGFLPKRGLDLPSSLTPSLVASLAASLALLLLSLFGNSQVLVVASTWPGSQQDAFASHHASGESWGSGEPPPSSAHFVSKGEATALREEVRGMFLHAYHGYMAHAFPLDELKPRSCRGEDTLGGYALTLIDALDTLALMGNHSEFATSVKWLGRNLNFDINKTVSVFETNIRILGGLLSAHLIASDDATGVLVPGYAGELLALAEDLGRRLLPAFDTPTGIPYGSVNLKYGVAEGESEVTSTAGGGTLILEFGALSRLTGDPVFEQVAMDALRGLWARRSQLGLVGAHINIVTGDWTHKDAGVGTSVDSFYEYLLKGHVLLGTDELLRTFREAYDSVLKHLFHDPWYVEVNMELGMMVWPLFNSLQAFWPGLQVQAGDVERAVRTHRAFFSVWSRFGFTPEGFNLQHGVVQPGQASYPLRPELAESTYWLYKATRDPWYLEVGRDMVTSLSLTRCLCGYCHVANVESRVLTDHMESFFLAETVKYLFLLFDLAATNGDNLVDNGPYQYVLTTEGHLLPMTPEISLAPSSHCAYLGAFCGEPKSGSCRLVEGSQSSPQGLGEGTGLELEERDGRGEGEGEEQGEGRGAEAGADAEDGGGELERDGLTGSPPGVSEEVSEPGGEQGDVEGRDSGAGGGQGATVAGGSEDPLLALGKEECGSISFWRSLGLDVQQLREAVLSETAEAAAAAAAAAV